jgi:hypothetical protein
VLLSERKPCEGDVITLPQRWLYSAHGVVGKGPHRVVRSVDYPWIEIAEGWLSISNGERFVYARFSGEQRTRNADTQ